jgi:hypothetical protein
MIPYGKALWIFRSWAIHLNDILLTNHSIVIENQSIGSIVIVRSVPVCFELGFKKLNTAPNPISLSQVVFATQPGCSLI